MTVAAPSPTLAPKGERTRQSILDRAVDIASLQGLQGLTIGSLAEELGMSKSGLFAHFGSKEELQIATIEAASQRYITEIFTEALHEPRGYPRLVAICNAWLSYIRRSVFPGGCFFAAASFEFDSRPGPVRDRVRHMMDDWMHALERSIRMAKDEGHLKDDVDSAQLAFELNSLFFGANFSFYLRDDQQAIERAERAVKTRLEALRK
ncbi:MAG TPA: TetR/AcrR family transcriptional regulator [Thermoanaerobaculia bacterium]|nr:TetR/AcrR family transcriptional regulator [Thermoanaerobaculia bacterium]